MPHTILTVADLIAQLQTCKPDAPVIIRGDGEYAYLGDLERVFAQEGPAGNPEVWVSGPGAGREGRQMVALFPVRR